MARSLRKTTGSHLSLTSNSTQWDTRHAWHTHVKDRSAFEPQGIWKLCVVVHTVQAGIYTIYPYLQPYSDLNYNSVNRLRAPHILRLTTIGRRDWCATCVNTRMINMAAGLKYFELWAAGVTGTLPLLYGGCTPVIGGETNQLGSLVSMGFYGQAWRGWPHGRNIPKDGRTSAMWDEMNQRSGLTHLFRVYMDGRGMATWKK